MGSQSLESALRSRCVRADWIGASLGRSNGSCPGVRPSVSGRRASGKLGNLDGMPRCGGVIRVGLRLSVGLSDNGRHDDQLAQARHRDLHEAVSGDGRTDGHMAAKLRFIGALRVPSQSLFRHLSADRERGLVIIPKAWAQYISRADVFCLSGEFEISSHPKLYIGSFLQSAFSSRGSS